MALACPQCGGSSQVVNLEGQWRALSQDAEAKKDLAPPPGYETRYTWPVLGVVLAVLVISSGGVLLGLLILLVAVAAGARMWNQAEAAREKRAEWKRALYCGTCKHKFDPKEAKLV
ncbi:hypothetical protein [Streptomyces jeddahensis]|uniref:Uncharacterized protein n=1 Tax=Streptomyces jeddahensis TaxID=1716141 RepID=A0A177HPR4_9ACTN|nr:hypothetical protein [Streptomyces jeddahensis]OAH12599.1 hypothetical protein STSP_39450 [Streptomyces jeddahensis]